MEITGGNKPLLHGYRQKLIVGACLLVPISLAVLLPDQLGSIVGRESWQIELFGVVLFAGVLIWLARGMKCPACGVNLFWHAVGHAKSGNWLDSLFRESKCPKCGHGAGKTDKAVK
jgi:DNA-directed RNA polymerase subunit RPC12/RpoP